MSSLEAQALGTELEEGQVALFDPHPHSLSQAMSVPAHLVGGAGEEGFLPNPSSAPLQRSG